MSETDAGLPTGYRILQFDSVDSTMNEAERQAEAGAADGTLVLAYAQTSGRGRRGRSWSTDRGNLAMTLLLRPEEQIGRAHV